MKRLTPSKVLQTFRQRRARLQ